MSILPIIILTDKALRKKSEPVIVINKEITELINDMVDTLRSKPGLGLAAPQIGQLVRIIIIESRGVNDDEGNVIYENIPLKVLINPRIAKYSNKKVEMEEGCFSVPNVFGPVERPEKIKVVALDQFGKEIHINTGGLLSRIIQHEVDHLNGILFTDLVSDKSKLKKLPNREELQA